jgi:hypothetical protein
MNLGVSATRIMAVPSQDGAFLTAIVRHFPTSKVEYGAKATTCFPDLQMRTCHNTHRAQQRPRLQATF